ncbi:momilactone A synthase-like [Silene latifolia]|uniref:momilactone A synthase-like n=1 Tax=Silene latifolia TaxID=37657 RepID=UPI003D7741B8
MARYSASAEDKDTVFCFLVFQEIGELPKKTRLKNKVALITGGARRIGADTARTFINHGAKLVIADIQDDLAQSLCNELGPQSASFTHCDVTNEAHVKDAMDSTLAQRGKLDIMVNNAGILRQSSMSINITEVDPTEFEETLRVNLIGHFLGTKHVAKVIIPSRSGCIINTASLTSVMGGLASHAYTSSKYGVLGLTKNTAVELGKYGIRVNCVSPYLVPTPLVKKFFGLDDENISKVYSTLKGGYCMPEDVAEAMVFLGSDESKFVSGHNLVVDGGFSVTNAGFCIFEDTE